MVRRTRTFIMDNYAEADGVAGRRYLSFGNGARLYFPARVPGPLKFSSSGPDDQYSQLYDLEVVAIINSLDLPRYGLGNYLLSKHKEQPSNAEVKVLDDLSRSGKRLMGFCRTNLFKRLESNGPVFLQSLKRHILRNYIVFGILLSIIYHFHWNQMSFAYRTIDDRGRRCSHYAGRPV